MNHSIPIDIEDCDTAEEAVEREPGMMDAEAKLGFQELVSIDL